MEKNLIKILKKRKSIRRFIGKEVPDSLVKEILQLGMYAPTSCNQQLWRFIIIKDKSLKDRLIKEAASSTLISRAPVVIAIMYDNWNYKESIQGSSMAVQNILLAATYYDIGSLAMNSFGSERRVKKILKIPKNYKICCFVCLGYPTEEDKLSPQVPRKNISEVLDYNYFKNKDEIPYTYNPDKWSIKHLIEYQKYFCRKTFMGKKMDIYHPLEEALVGKIMENEKGTILDILSYDGSYFAEFPDEKIICTDLCDETSSYTKASVKINTKKSLKNFNFQILDLTKKSLLKNPFNTITMIYKAERVSSKIFHHLMMQSHSSLKKSGKVIIISRRKSLMFMLFYNTIKLLFGDDMRKTGIYSFFGPYKPIDSTRIKETLYENGFTAVSEKRYFLIPPFFDQAYQMFLQYKKSDGSTYLHRIRQENIFTKLITFILKIQGMKQNRFGSISVIEATK